MWNYTEQKCLVFLQIATVISATVTWEIAGIRKIGWGWTGVIWLYTILTYFLLDPIKFAVRYALSGEAWDLMVNQRVCETKTLLFSLTNLTIPCLRNMTHLMNRYMDHILSHMTW